MRSGGQVMTQSSSGGEFWAGVFVTLAIVGGFYMFSSKSPEDRPPAQAIAPKSPLSPVPVATVPVAVPEPEPSPKKRTHRYDAVEGAIYYYAAGVSEEEQKTGKRAPDMLAFRYMGKDAAGRDIVQYIMADGRVISTSKCTRPCRAIHKDDGSVIGFDEGSVIGAVFLDVADGYLKHWKSPEPEPVNPTSPAELRMKDTR